MAAVERRATAGADGAPAAEPASETQSVLSMPSSDMVLDAEGPRHGALLQPEMEDWMLLESPYMTHWSNKRHYTNGDPRARHAVELPDWRMRERLRTVTAALVMCLNIGVDPPDVSKTNPCAKLICWMDPDSLEASKALPAIGRNLQVQFETLSMKTRYKQYLDPIIEETKRFCTNLRRTAKDERVLFYYNGFGVPKPTPGGEIWVFNKAYTQYIPLTLYDLQTWLGSPCIYVWDASASGNIVNHFRRLAQGRYEEEAKLAAAEGRERPPRPSPDGITLDAAGEPQFPLRESIHLAACGADEVLPMNPDLPADLFTCCLTSPIEISLRWFVLQNPLPSNLNVDVVMNIPGRLQDRRTPLGELNWILTAVTDTIAWTVLPRAIFRRFFRDDLMVAALLRNFLLAERIMRFYHCTPVSYPRLPPTHDHPLWASWDLAVDQCLAQLPTLLAKEQARAEAAAGGAPVPPHLAAFEYTHSAFFSEQLKAFEVWLSQGDVSRRSRRRRVGRHAAVRWAPQPTPGHVTTPGSAPAEEEEDAALATLHDPPTQLPIVLQVLLSQVHRLRALILLSQFLDLGPWAVNLALSIGIFPYVLKLLQSPAADLKPVLIYIWARILAVDRSCQIDLLRDNGYLYFTTVLSPFQPGAPGAWAGPNALHTAGPNVLPIPNVSEHRAMCAFILAVFCQEFPAGQDACLETDTMDSCLEHLEDDDFLLRQWSALCLAQLWDNSNVGKARAIAKDAHGKLCCLLSDASPEVRAAMLYALGVLLGAGSGTHTGATREPRAGQAPAPCVGTGSLTGLHPARQRSLEVGVGIAVLASSSDCSPLVRKELVVLLSALALNYQGTFALAAYMYFARELEQALAMDLVPTDAFLLADVNLRVELEEHLLTEVYAHVARHAELADEDIANTPAFLSIWATLLTLATDPHPEVADLARTVVDRIVALLFEAGVFTARDSVVNPLTRDEVERRTRVPTKLGTQVESRAPHVAAPGDTPPRSAEAPRPSLSTLARTVRAITSLGSALPASPGAPSEQAPSPRRGAFRVAAPRRCHAPAYAAPYDAARMPRTDAAASKVSTQAGRPPAARRSASAESLAAYSSLRRRPPGAGPERPTVETALAELIVADLRRLQARSTPQEPGSGASTPLLPGSSAARGDTPASAALVETLPLQSRLFAWCSEYYTEPQMKAAEADEPGSVQYNRQTWHRQRCERQIAEASEQTPVASARRWSERVGTLHVPSAPALLAFHEYEPYLVLAAERDTLAVYDWEEQTLLSSFANRNPAGTAITSLQFINQEVDALLLTGSADGDVRIFRQYDEPPRCAADDTEPHAGGPELVSAFRALPDLVRSNHPSGLVVDWQQVNGRLIAAGDARVVRVWDAHRELCVSDIPTHGSSCVTSLTSDHDIGHLFMAGFGDGAIGVYDQRNPPSSSLVRLWEEHNAWVQKVHLQAHGARELLSASVDGEVRLWDIRARSSMRQANLGASFGYPISSVAVHDRMPVFAAVSHARLSGSSFMQFASLGSLADLAPIGNPLRRFMHTTHPGMLHTPAHYRAWLQDHLGPPSPFSLATGQVALHPHYPVVAYGGPDMGVEIRRCPMPK